MENDFLTLAKDRYSLKKYSDKKVEKDKLDLILEAGNLAPTAKDSQPQRIYVVTDEKALSGIREGTPCTYGASTVLVVSFEKSEVFNYPDGDRDSGAEDCAIVATHMMLEAKALGIDSCWINNFRSAPIKAALNMPDSEEIVLLLDLGYPAEDAGPLPNHEKRKSILKTVKFV